MASEAIPAIAPQFITLPDTNPPRILAYTLTTIEAKDPTSDHNRQVFLVFVNGLGLPQIAWQPAIELFKKHVMDDSTALSRNTQYTLLTYDRPGQGFSVPPRASAPEPHDIQTSVEDLDWMIRHFSPSSSLPTSTTTSSEISNTPPPKTNPKVLQILIGHSIGVPLCRLYISQNPYQTSAFLVLDSNPANTDFVSLFPDPTSADFNPATDLPSDTTVAQLETARANYRKFFHPSAPNPEMLDRRNLKTLLPFANKPVLYGPPVVSISSSSPDNNNNNNNNINKEKENQKLQITIIAHDPETFGEEALKMSTRGLSEKYLEPAWRAYNIGLLELGLPSTSLSSSSNNETKNKGKVIIAKGAGHFIQRDNPGCVADEIFKLVRRVVL